MPFWGSRDDEAVDDFDVYDPTPYSGGYDQVLTYGRPLPESEETCYAISVAGDVDYERPNYSSNAQSSVYEADEAEFGDRYGRPRPKPQIRPSYGADESAGGEYGSEYGSGCGGRPERKEYGSEHEPRYGGGKPKIDEEDYGRKVQHGSSYGRQETKPYGEEGYVGQGYGGGGYRRSDEEGFGKQGYGGANFRNSDEEGLTRKVMGVKAMAVLNTGVMNRAMVEAVVVLAGRMSLFIRAGQAMRSQAMVGTRKEVGDTSSRAIVMRECDMRIQASMVEKRDMVALNMATNLLTMKKASPAIQSITTTTTATTTKTEPILLRRYNGPGMDETRANYLS